MSVYYPIGKTLVPTEELFSRSASGEIAEVVRKARTGHAESLAFSSGVVTAEELAAVLPSGRRVAFRETGREVPFVEIGLNRPLTIQVVHLYVGTDSPDGKDMLVTTAVKGASVYKAAPRALNQLSRGVRRGQHFTGVPAPEQGTYLVYYTPAALDTQANLTIEIAFDRFKKEVFDTVGDVFSKAAGIPVFVPYAGLLVAVGLVTKLIGKVCEQIVDNAPDFSAQMPIYLHQPGMEVPEPGFRILGSGLSAQDRHDFYFDPHTPEKGLVNNAGEQYDGLATYVVLSLDGREQDSLKDFAPTAATAAVLDRFTKTKEGSEVGSEVLLDALKLYNDMEFRSKATEVGQRLKAEKDPEAKKSLEERYDALVASILTPELKPATS